MSWENISVKKNLLKNTDSELFTRKSVHSEMCIVGYLDILGSKQRILEDNSDYSLNSVYNLYNSTQNLFKKLKGVEYYKDIIKVLGVDVSECVMVGNDVGEDMIAKKLDMKVFLLTDCLINKKQADINAYPHGGFSELCDFLDSLNK